MNYTDEQPDEEGHRVKSVASLASVSREHVSYLPAGDAFTNLEALALFVKKTSLPS